MRAKEMFNRHQFLEVLILVKLKFLFQEKQILGKEINSLTYVKMNIFC